MSTKRGLTAATAATALALLLAALPAGADVLHLDPGLTSLQLVPVGDPGNAADSRYASPGFGAVAYAYNIGTYEVTAAQYTQFLNAVAGVDTYALYNTNMWTNARGCHIERYAGTGTGADPYQYRVAADWANRPVNYVCWGDAARFANWLHNGQPTGAQDLPTTEDGAYCLNGATTNPQYLAVTRQAGWKWAIPSENEWYKAAYYNPATASYFNYPTGTDSLPSNVLGDPADPGNNATFNNGTYTIGAPYYLTEVGAHENSKSPCGTFDQGGNAWEWNEAVIGNYNGLRGGSVNLAATYMLASGRYTSASRTEDFVTGFRVVQAPQPPQPPECHPGDANGDGTVDLQDFGVLKDNFGATSGASWAMGDFTADGTVDLQDFGVLKDHFGHTAADSPVTAVPEPASAALLLASLTAFRRRRP